MKAIVPEARWDESRHYWKCNVQKDGVRKSFYEKTEGRRGKRVCEAKAQEWVESNCPTDMKFAQAWEKFLAYKKQHLSRESYEAYVSTGKKHLLPLLGNKRLSLITPQHWQDCLDEAAARGMARATCINLRGKIVSFAKFAKRSRFQIEPVADLEVIKDDGREKRTTLQPEHLRVLFDVDTFLFHGRRRPDEYVHAYRFGALTGLRRGELVGLRWEDVAEDCSSISLKRSINRYGEETKGKTVNARRSFVLPDLAVQELKIQRQMLLSRNIISPWVFPDKHGNVTVPTTLLARWKHYCADNGLPDFVFHELRHTAVSVYEATVPEKLLKAAIGHSDAMDTAGVYGHKFGDEDKQAADLMNKALAGVFRTTL